MKCTLDGTYPSNISDWSFSMFSMSIFYGHFGMENVLHPLTAIGGETDTSTHQNRNDIVSPEKNEIKDGETINLISLSISIKSYRDW